MQVMYMQLFVVFRQCPEGRQRSAMLASRRVSSPDSMVRNYLQQFPPYTVVEVGPVGPQFTCQPLLLWRESPHVLYFRCAALVVGGHITHVATVYISEHGLQSYSAHMHILRGSVVPQAASIGHLRTAACLGGIQTASYGEQLAKNLLFSPTLQCKLNHTLF